ncbi:hypothetical protein E2C01_047413 [Portunus trituberculatus]|uniref:Uncharacterized protein n=1 Tax=Portunus trituberculatus TaxID=210409 RepID=A0A5B7G8S3_PORTR|nr:hypothetical protein [Portunus trituberculatus]
MHKCHTQDLNWFIPNHKTYDTSGFTRYIILDKSYNANWYLNTFLAHFTRSHITYPSASLM